ncbi:MAG: hypothetical protein AAFY34_03535 [Pseudomonadota bacterium]
MAKSTDMNGIWSGMYNYDDFDMTVKFTAWLDDQAGILGGTTMEPNTFMPDGPDDLMAVVKGARSALDVAFQKSYDQSTGIVQPTLIYEGESNRDFTEVRGVWRFDEPLKVAGEFRLIRMAEGVASKLARMRAASVDIDLKS